MNRFSVNFFFLDEEEEEEEPEEELKEKNQPLVPIFSNVGLTSVKNLSSSSFIFYFFSSKKIK